MLAGEEYLQDADVAGAYSGDEMLALQAADTAVTRMVAQNVRILPPANWDTGHSN